MSPLISVVIPSYNSAHLIEKALDSFLEQTFADTEVIVVDDGSTDGTSEVVSRYSSPKVRLLRQYRSERSAARNAGIAHCQGDFIAFLDADDWWHPEKLERQLALFGRNDQLGLVYCSLQQIGPSGNPLRVVKGIDAGAHSEGSWMFEHLLMGNIGGPGSSVLVSRRCLEDTGGFDPELSYGEDWDFCLRVAHKYQIGFVAEPLVFYRAHGYYLPEKMHRLDMQQACVRIVSDALALGGLSKGSPLARKAMAKALYHGALVDVGVQEYKAANERFAEAMSVDPTAFDGDTPSAIEFVAYFANLLYDTVTPLDEALSFVNALFDQLTGNAAKLNRFRRKTLALTCVVHALEGKVLSLPEHTRRAFWRGIAYDPRWLRNRHFVVGGLQALVARNTSI